MNIAEEFNLDRERFVWQDLSMCDGIEPLAIFFEESESNPNVANAVKSICDYCPVKEMCRQDAIDTKAHGIRGGDMFVGGKVAKH